jgi:hypothetical protein
MLTRSLGVTIAALLSLAFPCRASVTADLTLSLRYWNTDSLNNTRVGYFRLLADADLPVDTRFHLDVDRDENGVDLYEAFGEWGKGRHRGRLGYFEVPFGIHNRTELYYVGLISLPLIRYYPFQSPGIGRSASGVGYLGSLGAWQLEAALFGHGGSIESLVPSGGEGAVRIQHYSGPLILGISALRERVSAGDPDYRGTGYFYGLDFRYSRPMLILRGELVAGNVPGGSPRGFYLDVLYHPSSFGRVTLVGRTEAVRGQPQIGRTYSRQTIGFKWLLVRGTTLAVNQSFDSPRGPFSLQGTSLFLWHTRRL